MQLSRRRILEASGIVLGALAGCTESPAETPTPTEPPAETPTSSPTGTPSPTPSGLDGEITVEGSEWVLVPDAFEAKVGRKLTVHYENVGEVAHNLAVGSFPKSERSATEQAEAGTFMAKTETIQPGRTATVTFTPASTGTFPYWCDVPGHREAGMLGAMTVVE